MMTREEAIAVLEESKRQNEIMRDNPTTFLASQQMAEGVKNAQRRIAALELVLTALRGPTREMVERMRGEWMKTSEYMPIFGCSKCGERNLFRNGDNVFSDFCPACGSPMTDEAVGIMLERWREALGDEVRDVRENI